MEDSNEVVRLLTEMRDLQAQGIDLHRQIIERQKRSFSLYQRVVSLSLANMVLWLLLGGWFLFRR